LKPTPIHQPRPEVREETAGAVVDRTRGAEQPCNGLLVGAQGMSDDGPDCGSSTTTAVSFDRRQA